MSLRKKLIKKFNLKPTKTTVFFLPIFGYGLKRYTESFAGMYISDFKKPKIAIVFEDDQSNISLEDFISILAEDVYYNQCWDDEGEIIVEMNLPNEYYYDFKMFLEGKYSEFTDNFKNILVRFYGKERSTNSKVTMYEVLYPSEEKKRMIADDLDVNIKIIPNEIFSIPKLKHERYLNIQDFKKEYKETESLKI